MVNNKFKNQLEQEFAGLEEYVLESSRFLNKKQDGFSADITPYLLRNSLFIAIWSFTEYSLKRYCEYAAGDSYSLQRKLNRLNRIYQYYEFLRNDLALNLIGVDNEWEKLDVFRGIRNCLVHHPSEVKKVHLKTYEFIKEDSRIFFEEPDVFRIADNSLIFELLGVSKKFLFNLPDK